MANIIIIEAIKKRKVIPVMKSSYPESVRKPIYLLGNDWVSFR